MNGGIWGRLEGTVRDAMEALGEGSVLVYTGATYDSSSERSREKGDSGADVAVPTTMYKVMYSRAYTAAIAVYAANKDDATLQIMSVAELQRLTRQQVFAQGVVKNENDTAWGSERFGTGVANWFAEKLGVRIMLSEDGMNAQYGRMLHTVYMKAE